MPVILHNLDNCYLFFSRPYLIQDLFQKFHINGISSMLLKKEKINSKTITLSRFLFETLLDQAVNREDFKAIDYWQSNYNIPTELLWKVSLKSEKISIVKYFFSDLDTTTMGDLDFSSCLKTVTDIPLFHYCILNNYFYLFKYYWSRSSNQIQILDDLIKSMIYVSQDSLRIFEYIFQDPKFNPAKFIYSAYFKRKPYLTNYLLSLVTIEQAHEHTKKERLWVDNVGYIEEYGYGLEEFIDKFYATRQCHRIFYCRCEMEYGVCMNDLDDNDNLAMPLLFDPEKYCDKDLIRYFVHFYPNIERKNFLARYFAYGTWSFYWVEFFLKHNNPRQRAILDIDELLPNSRPENLNLIRNIFWDENFLVSD